MSLSVAIICRNSSDVIERCLESVKDADEIVVVDTGSFDNTIEIAKRYTDKVYEYWGCNEGGKKDGLFMSFADARNKALEYCTMTHIFSIDADEVLEQGMDEMKKFEGISLAVRCISATTGEEHYQPRCYINHEKVKWFGAAHNYLKVPTGEKSDVVITYYSNKQKKNDPDRTMRILERWVKNNPDDCAREMYYLAKEYFNRSWYEKAIKTFSDYINISEFDAEKADACVYLSRCYFAIDKYNEAVNACLSAININPAFKEALILAGELSQKISSRLKWKHLATKANNSGVLFVRHDRRIKVTVLSVWDWAGSGYKMAEAIRKASGALVDIEALTLNEGQGTDFYNIQTGISIDRVGKEVAQSRINESDILHFKGDWLIGDKFGELELNNQKRIYTVSGSFFRKMEDGLNKSVVARQNHEDEYIADYLSAITPDLIYNDSWKWMPHAYDDFEYSWEKGRKFKLSHVVNSRAKKGTDIFEDAVKLLNRKDVELISKVNISHQESMKLKKHSHLYLDQLIIWAYGMAAIEAMGYGIPVFGGIKPELYPEDCPVIYPENRTVESVAEKLNEILNWKTLKELSEKTFEYCREVHGKVGEKWIEVYNNLVE